MKFERIGLKNFRSFGNNYQEIDLGQIGLTALIGRNGSGKTSLAEAIEYALYGKVRSRKKKKTSNKSNLLNRINKSNLMVKLTVNDGLIIERCMSPDTFSVTRNGKNAEEEYKKLIKTIPEDIFINFISFNSKDFKDFLHLSKHDKDLVLDKLFNMYAFAELQEQIEKLQNDNLEILLKYKNDNQKYVYAVEKMTKKINDILTKRKEKKSVLNVDHQKKMEELRPQYEKLQKRLNELQSTKNAYMSKWEDLQLKLSDAKAKLGAINEKLDLYEEKKCPTCGSNLDTSEHSNVKETLLLKKEKLKNAIEIGSKMVSKIREESLKETKEENVLREQLTHLTTEIKIIKKEKENSEITHTEEDNDWKSEIENLTKKIEELSTSLKKSERLNEVYVFLLDVLDVDKNRKALLKDLTPKINRDVFKHMSKVGMHFLLNFNEDMECEIQQLGSKIDEDTLSEGETSCINLACLLAFMKQSNINKYTNMLFTDEIFEKVDEENIQTLLKMIKSFAEEEKIEIIFVHQKSLNEELFDRSIKMEKDIYSFSKISQK